MAWAGREFKDNLVPADMGTETSRKTIKLQDQAPHVILLPSSDNKENKPALINSLNSSSNTHLEFLLCLFPLPFFFHLFFHTS